AGEGRRWEKLTVGELKIWLAILIYIGIFKLPSIRDYWNRDDRFSEYKITTFMSLLHFEQ
ncbi:8482_t:CDS:1, partial [Racocetra persica]